MILGLGTLKAAVYSPAGKYIATAGSLGAFLWDAESGALLRTFRGHTNNVFSVAFSPDGTRVLTGSQDGTAKLRDAENWLQPQPPLPPPPPKGRACFIYDTGVWLDGVLAPISKVGVGQNIGRIDSAGLGGFSQSLPRPGKVEKVQEHEGTFVCYDVLLESGNCISVAERHYFMTESGRWVAVQDLKAQIRLRTPQGSIGIKSVNRRPIPYVGKVYNLRIEGSDWYLVGEDAVVVRDY